MSDKSKSKVELELSSVADSGSRVSFGEAVFSSFISILAVETSSSTVFVSISDVSFCRVPLLFNG